MDFIFFLVRRFNSSRKQVSGFSFFSGIVITGIAIGAAALIIALTVQKGFEFVLRDRLINLDSHIIIYPQNYNRLTPTKQLVPEIRKLIAPLSCTYASYIDKYVLVSHSKKREAVQVRGVTGDYFNDKTTLNVVQGKLAPAQSGSMVLGKFLAEKLFAKMGDKITIFALRESMLPDKNNPPIFEQFTITGIFESGIAQFDDNVVYIYQKDAERIFGFAPDCANGIEVRLKSADNIDSLTTYLQENLPKPYNAVNIYKMHPQIFTWIELQKKPIPIVLTLIIIVAVFNIISVTLMLILEKSSSIGVLRTLGIKRRQIGIIFLLQAMYLSFIGVMLGNILAFTLCKLQLKYNIITLPANIYFTSKVPLLLTADTFIIVSVFSFLMSVAAALIPAYIASRFSPLKTIGFA